MGQMLPFLKFHFRVAMAVSPILQKNRWAVDTLLRFTGTEEDTLLLFWEPILAPKSYNMLIFYLLHDS